MTDLEHLAALEAAATSPRGLTRWYMQPAQRAFYMQMKIALPALLSELKAAREVVAASRKLMRKSHHEDIYVSGLDAALVAYDRATSGGPSE